MADEIERDHRLAPYLHAVREIPIDPETEGKVIHLLYAKLQASRAARALAPPARDASAAAEPPPAARDFAETLRDVWPELRALLDEETARSLLPAVARAQAGVRPPAARGAALRAAPR